MTIFREAQKHFYRSILFTESRFRVASLLALGVEADDLLILDRDGLQNPGLVDGAVGRLLLLAVVQVVAGEHRQDGKVASFLRRIVRHDEIGELNDLHEC